MIEDPYTGVDNFWMIITNFRIKKKKYTWNPFEGYKMKNYIAQGNTTNDRWWCTFKDLKSALKCTEDFLTRNKEYLPEIGLEIKYMSFKEYSKRRGHYE